MGLGWCVGLVWCVGFGWCVGLEWCVGLGRPVDSSVQVVFNEAVVVWLPNG